MHSVTVTLCIVVKLYILQRKCLNKCVTDRQTDGLTDDIIMSIADHNV